MSVSSTARETQSSPGRAGEGKVTLYLETILLRHSLLSPSLSLLFMTQCSELRNGGCSEVTGRPLGLNQGAAQARYPSWSGRAWSRAADL